MSPAASPVLRARALGVRLGRAEVLRDVTLEVPEGMLTVVLGPNGAGKSTLLRALLGLIPTARGTVELFGRPAGELDRRALARRVAWVPQRFEPEEGFTGLELVLMGRAPHQPGWGLPSPGEISRARAILEELGIGHLENRPAGAMSGGETRLLVLARALVQEPALLVLDEPTAFLDVRHQVEVLERIRGRLGPSLSALAVLHDLNLAAAFADRVVLLREGRVLAEGARSEVLTREGLRALYGLEMLEMRAPGGRSVFAPVVG